MYPFFLSNYIHFFCEIHWVGLNFPRRLKASLTVHYRLEVLSAGTEVTSSDITSSRNVEYFTELFSWFFYSSCFLFPITSPFFISQCIKWNHSLTAVIGQTFVGRSKLLPLSDIMAADIILSHKQTMKLWLRGIFATPLHNWIAL